MVYKEIGTELPEVWKPEKKGDLIEGTLLKKKENCGPNKSALYILEIEFEDKTEKKGVWGSTVLDDKMDEISPGDKIKITYLGKEKTYHKYKVEKDFPDEEGSDENSNEDSKESSEED